MYDLDNSSTLSDSSLALVEELREIREATKALKARESEIRSLLLEELNDASQGLTASGVPVVEVDNQVRTRVDTKRLQALYQDAWKDCQRETVVQVLRLPELPVEITFD